MTGEYKHTLDVKGRIFIPARLREELGGVFYITVSPENCLMAYSSDGWRAFSEKANSLPFVHQRKLRPLFSNAARCEPDGQGRVLIPATLRERAGLAKTVAIIGCNNHVEFWDADTWDEVNKTETEPENIMAVMEEFLF